MREIGKTKAASVLIALSCCAVAFIAFQIHRDREERSTAPATPVSIQETVSSSALEQPVIVEPTVVLTCRLEHVKLTAGVHRN